MVTKKLMSKVFAVLLSLLLVCSVFPITTFAMEIMVKVETSNESFAIEVEPTDSIEDIKAKIQDIKGYEPENQKLYFNNMILEDGNTLQYYSVFKNSEIILITMSQPALDGRYYLISNAEELYWFSDYANNTDPTAYGKLVSDIVVNENVLDDKGNLNENGSSYMLWEPIGGSDYNKFDGIFDGNGYTVSGLYTDGTSEYQGLFGSLGGSGTIKNVGVVDSYISASEYAGGVCGYNYKGQIINCYNTATVAGSAEDARVGGIAGYSYYSVENCFNTGSVTAQGSNVGSIVGFSYNAVTNCYYLEGTAEKGIGNDSGEAYSKSADEFKNGAVTYILNGQKSDGIWYQNIDLGVKDNHPTLNSSHGKVYKITICSGDVGYSNTNSDITEHNFDNGFCTVCDKYQQPVLVSGVYQITNAGELYWYADYVNTVDSSASASLVNDIVVNESVLDYNGNLKSDGSNLRIWTPIGDEYNFYTGTFDGNENSVSGLYLSNSNDYEGFIAYLGEEGLVQNLFIEDSYISANNYVGGITGFNDDAIVYNCFNFATVKGNQYVGGVVGCTHGEITECSNAGVVTGSYAGGICGYNSKSTISDCVNISIVDGEDYIGGIVGYNYYIVDNCNNSGEVYGNERVGGVAGENDAIIRNSTNMYIVDGKNNVGGISGRNNYLIEKSRNFGEITGENYVGGITGYNYRGIKNSYNVCSVTGVDFVGGISGINLTTEKYCFSYAAVTGESNVGDICGSNAEDAVTSDCYYLKTSAQSKNEYGVPMNEYDFEVGAVAYQLNINNSDPVWGQTLGEDDYPDLNGDEVYAGYENCGSIDLSYSNTEGELYETKPKHNYGSWSSDLNGYHTGVCTVCFDITREKCSGGNASYFNRAVCDYCHQEYGEILQDTTAPTGEIIVGENKWHEFLNAITFGLFFNDTQTVSITANDDSYSHTGYTEDNAVEISYYLYNGTDALTEDQLNKLTFIGYDASFNIDSDNSYVIYAKLVDHAGNVTYINSNGIVIDKTLPVVNGIENNKTYCSSVEVTVTDENVDTVTVNGKEINIVNGKFTLSPSNDQQTIVVTDKAKNSVTYVITVNNGHTFNNYLSNNDASCTKDSTETAKCEFCDATDTRIDEDSAIGHNYGEPIWIWSEDGKSASAKFICLNDETHIEQPTVTVTSKVTKNPTCTEKGITTYTATVEFNNTLYTDSREMSDIPALGHNFEDGVCVVDGVIDENYKQESNDDNTAVNTDKSTTSPLTGADVSAVAYLGLFIVLAVIFVIVKCSKKFKLS